jgi:hypothetical protein
MDDQIPSIGRSVHFVLDSGPNKGEHRPAVIVKTWGDLPTSAVNLQVFTDSNPLETSNDCLPPVLWKTSVVQDPTGKKPYSWHWPERV